MDIRFFKIIGIAGVLAASPLMLSLSAQAQTITSNNFSFTTGYDPDSTASGEIPVLSSTGATPTDEVNYNIFDNGGSSGNSTAQAFYTTDTNGYDISDSPSPTSSTPAAYYPFHAVQSLFTVPLTTQTSTTTTTSNVSLTTSTTITFFAYVNGGDANAITNVSYEIYRNDPNTVVDPVSGSYTPIAISSTGTTDVASIVGTRVTTNPSAPQTRTLYEIQFNLSSAVDLTAGDSVADSTYFLGVSADSNEGDVFIPYAKTTDPNGQPIGTNGDADVFNNAPASSGGTGGTYATFLPNNSTAAPNNDNLVGFEMLINGATITSDTEPTPEPNSFLLALAVLPIAAAVSVRRRKTRSLK